jgi:hypothetical protein
VVRVRVGAANAPTPAEAERLEGRHDARLVLGGGAHEEVQILRVPRVAVECHRMAAGDQEVSATGGRQREQLARVLAAAPDDRDLHLYLTDYRSLYVADVEQVSDTDPRAADAAHVPPHTPSAGFSCDCWFRLRDVRALVPGDLKGVAAELSRLRNTHYHDKAVSLHGGKVELPLLVTRPDWRRYFQDGERDLLADGQRWVRFDAEQGGEGALEAMLRDDHLGELVWHGLDAAARRFLATALATALDPPGWCTSTAAPSSSRAPSRSPSARSQAPWAGSRRCRRSCAGCSPTAPDAPASWPWCSTSAPWYGTPRRTGSRSRGPRRCSGGIGCWGWGVRGWQGGWGGCGGGRGRFGRRLIGRLCVGQGKARRHRRPLQQGRRVAGQDRTKASSGVTSPRSAARIASR